MRNSRFSRWMETGTSEQRFAKEFVFYFCINMALWVAFYYAGRAMGWKSIFRDAPFISEEFWATCLSFAFGFAITNVMTLNDRNRKKQLAEAEKSGLI